MDLYLNLERRLLVTSYNNPHDPFPDDDEGGNDKWYPDKFRTVFQGQSLRLHAVQSTGKQWGNSPVFEPVPAAEFSDKDIVFRVSHAGNAPSEAVVSFSYDGEETTETFNLSTWTMDGIERALNALDTVKAEGTGLGLSVTGLRNSDVPSTRRGSDGLGTLTSNGFTVTWNEAGARSPIVVNMKSSWYPAVGRYAAKVAGTVSLAEVGTVHLETEPLFEIGADDWTLVNTEPTANVEVTQSPSSGNDWQAVVRISLSPVPAGGRVTLTLAGEGSFAHDICSLNRQPREFASMIRETGALASGEWVEVDKVGDYTWDVRLGLSSGDDPVIAMGVGSLVAREYLEHEDIDIAGSVLETVLDTTPAGEAVRLKFEIVDTLDERILLNLGF